MKHGKDRSIKLTDNAVEVAGVELLMVIGGKGQIVSTVLTGVRNVPSADACFRGMTMKGSFKRWMNLSFFD